MPLNLSMLVSGLTNIFMSQPSTPSLAAMQIAMQYDNYCKLGMAPPGLPIFTGTEAKKLELQLLSALSSQSSSPSLVANAFSTGLQMYWLSPPVMFSGGPAMGVATSMAGVGAVVWLVTAALSNIGNTEQSVAAQIGAALDTATRTLLVVYSTPPPPTGPPPPSMLI